MQQMQNVEVEMRVLKIMEDLSKTPINQGYGPKKLRSSSSDSRKLSGRGFMCLSSLVLISYLHKYLKRRCYHWS